MTTDATPTSKGQTTIPKEIRDSRGLKPGDRMTFTLMTDGTWSCGHCGKLRGRFGGRRLDKC